MTMFGRGTYRYLMIFIDSWVQYLWLPGFGTRQKMASRIKTRQGWPSGVSASASLEATTPELKRERLNMVEPYMSVCERYFVSASVSFLVLF